jgi:site-specific DNA-methyltransferase (adenine-specific)
MACAIEDAGFEIRDQIGWMFGSGFPKSHDVSKGIDARIMHGNSHSRSMKLANETRPGPGRIRQSTLNNGIMGEASGEKITRDEPATPEAAAWQGWGTALKPACEPCIVARKPLIGSVAANVLRYGCGAMNIDACRVPAEARPLLEHTGRSGNVFGAGLEGSRAIGTTTEGRWPANVIHDGSAEVEEAFAAFGATTKPNGRPNCKGGSYGQDRDVHGARDGRTAAYNGGYLDSGTASRFFFSAKADKADRAGSLHPTIKPTSLMRWLVQLVTPPGGTVLDPFAGSGSTGLAADQLGMNAVLIESDPEYAADIERKITGDAPLFADVAVAKAPAPKEAGQEQLGMFGDAA